MLGAYLALYQGLTALAPRSQAEAAARGCAHVLSRLASAGFVEISALRAL